MPEPDYAWGAWTCHVHRIIAKPFSVLESWRIYIYTMSPFFWWGLDHLPPLLAFSSQVRSVFWAEIGSEFWPCFVVSFETEELYYP
jgi:hypothetical protein